MEFSVTAAMVAGGFALFGLAVKHLPIFEDEHHNQPSQPAAQKGVIASVEVATNAGD